MTLPAGLRRRWPRPCRSRAVIILDGLDQQEERARELLWLPHRLPASIRLVLTAHTDGAAMLQCKRREYELASMVALSEGERLTMLRTYLQHSSKRLTDKQALAIASAPQAAKPRFLRTLA